MAALLTAHQVMLFLMAEPVPEKCELRDPAPIATTINTPASFDFEARDLEGIEILRTGFNFTGTLRSCLDMACDDTELLIQHAPTVLFSGDAYSASVPRPCKPFCLPRPRAQPNAQPYTQP